MSAKNIFQDRLFTARKTRGLLQEDLANLSNLQPTAISHFENGTRKPSFENLKKLADALEVTSDYLLGRTDDQKTYKNNEPLYRHFENLTADERELAREFMKNLAKRSKGKKK